MLQDNFEDFKKKTNFHFQN